jgi:hypothetical protein
MFKKTAITIIFALLLGSVSYGDGTTTKLLKNGNLKGIHTVTTFNNAGLYLKYATPNKDIKTRVLYKKTTALNWENGLGLIYDPRASEFRGSLLCLSEETAYDVKIEIYNKSKLKESFSSVFKTWSSTVPISKTINFDDLYKENEQVFINQNGTPDGWIKILGDKNKTYTFSDDFIEAISVRNASYIIFENINIKGGGRNGFFIKNSDNIRLINCEITDWGRVGIQKFRGREHSSADYWGWYFDKNDAYINWDNAVTVELSSRVVIERCYFHDPKGKSNPWLYSHPAGMHALVFKGKKGNHVVRYNDFIGSDVHRWNDAIGGGGNSNEDGGVYRDSDIYGNYFAFGNDDGVELDGGQMNVRFYENKIEGFLCGISTAMCRLGPSYIFRNLVINLGDENGHTGSFIKNGIGTDKKTKKMFDNFGLVYIVNNTFHSKGDGIRAYNGGMHVYSRNNIICSLPFKHSIAGNYNPKTNFLDFDLMHGDSFISDSLGNPAEKNGLVGKPDFQNLKSGNYKLSPASLGVDKGTIVNNISEAYTGQGPDMGAFEGDEKKMIPTRPIDITCDKYQLNFKNTITSISKAKQITLIVGNLEKDEPFTIKKNRDFDWIKTSVQDGVLKSHSKLVISVSIDSTKAKKGAYLRGAFIVKLTSGYSIPLVVYAKTYDRKFYKMIEAEDAGSETLTGLYEIKSDKKASAGSYIYPVLKGRKKGDNFAEYDLELPTSGNYYLFIKIKSDTPVTGANSCYFRINNSKKMEASFTSSIEWVYSGVAFNKKKRDYEPIKMNKGANKIFIAPRESGLSIDYIVVSSDPFPTTYTGAEDSYLLYYDY